MRTEDHFLLASHITRDSGLHWLRRRMFLLGNIIPDVNRLTYLGPHRVYFSVGHSFKAQRRKFRHLFRHPYGNSLLWWYHAGRAFHYLTDSFTRPHNPELGYNDKSHVSYELRLQRIFEDRLIENRWPVPKIKGDPYQWLLRRHAAYMRHSRDLEEDCFYIITTVTAVWEKLEELRHSEA